MINATYITPTRPLTPDELTLICRVWSNKGSDDPTGQWLELWDGGDANMFPEERDAILAVATSCGLQPALEHGILRVRKTQQLHDELSKW